MWCFGDVFCLDFGVEIPNFCANFATMNHTNPIIILLVASLVLLAGCRHEVIHYDYRLEVADSVLRHDPDSVLTMLGAIDVGSLQGDGDRAYYALLLTQAQYRCYITAPSDSVIDVALDYYERHPEERNLLTRAYIYKGAVIEELGQAEEAMTYYKRALTNAAADDIFNQGYARLRIGNIYRDHHVADSSDIMMFKEALGYFRQLPDSFYIMTCLTQIGNSYIKNNVDSVLPYLNQSNEIASRLNNKSFQAMNDLLIAKHKMYSDDPHEVSQAMDIACQLIAEGDSTNDKGPLLMTAAFALARLNQPNLAQKYLSEAKGHLEVPEDTILYERCQAEIARCRGDIDGYQHHFVRSLDITFGVSINAMQQRLRDVETKYDNEALKNQALEYRTHWIMSLLGVALLASVLAITVLLFMRILARRKRQLQESEDTIERLHHESARLSSLLNANAAMSNELKDTIRNQIKVFSRLVEEHTTNFAHSPRKFADFFEKAYRVTQPDGSFWAGLRAYANSQYNEIIDRTVEEYPSLIDTDINFLSLYCCDLPTTVIMACLGYKEAHSVYNKKRRVAEIMGCPNGLDAYIWEYKQFAAAAASPDPPNE